MLREIAARLGVEIDTAQVVAFMGALDGAKGALVTLGKALAVDRLVGFVHEQANAAAEIGRTAKKYGIAADDFERAQYILGGSAEDVGNTLFFLSKSIGEAAAAGGPGAAAFAKLGVKIKDTNGAIRSTGDILPETIAAISKHKSAAERTALATDIFGRGARGMLGILAAGPAKVKALTTEFEDLGGALEESVIQDSFLVVAAYKRHNSVLERLKITAASFAFGPLAWLITKLSKFEAVIYKAVKGTDVMTTSAIAMAAITYSKWAPSLVLLAKSLYAVGLQGARAAAGPLLLYLVFDDLFTLMTGGDSVVGRLLDSIGGIGAQQKTVEAFKSAWKALGNLWTDSQPALKEIGALLRDMFKESDGFGGALKSILVGIINTAAASIKAITDLIRAAKLASEGNYEGAGKVITESSDAIWGKRQGYWDSKTGEMVYGTTGGLFGTKPEAWAAQAAAGAASVQQTNYVTATVDARGMPAAAAKNPSAEGLTEAKQSQLRDAHGALAAPRTSAVGAGDSSE